MDNLTFSCSCDKTYTSNKRFNEHIKDSHCNEEVRTCGECHLVFSSKKSCKNHIENGICLRQKAHQDNKEDEEEEEEEEDKKEK